MLNTRPATLADLPDIYTMICDLSAFHGDTAQVTPDHLQQIFFGPHPMGTALIATQHGQTVGYAGLTPTMILHEGCVRIDIHHLFVKDGHRASGVGTALIAAAKSYAITTGATRLTIGTDAGNRAAIAAYRAMPVLQEVTNAAPFFRINLSD